MILKTILTIILIEQLFKLSIKYLNYEKVIRIDVKSNSEENDDLYVHIISEIGFNINTFDGKLKNPWVKQPCPFYGDFECSPLEVQISRFFDCLALNQFKPRDLFDKNHIQYYNRYFDYSIEQAIENSSMVSSYYYNPKEVCTFGFNLYTSFKLSRLQKYIERNAVFFKLSIKKWYIPILNIGITSALFISSYNTLKSYEPFMKMDDYLFVNRDLLFQKVLHKYLKPPHGMCDDYDNEDKTPFNSNNQWHCYRQCLKNLCQKEFKCKPVFIDNTINELDFTSNDLIDCNYSLQNSFDKFIEENNYRVKCLQICPKDCRNIDFKLRYLEYETGINFTEFQENLMQNMEKMIQTRTYPDSFTKFADKYQIEKKLVVDSSQPMFVYNEESVLSFIEYMCYCGGLIGLWFGTSAKDIVFVLIRFRFWIKIRLNSIKFN